MTEDRNALIERWPGYTEQSWVERFHELDRRYEALSQNFDVAMVAQALRDRQPVRDEEVPELVDKGLEDIHNDVRRVLEAFEELKKSFSEPTLEQLALTAVRVLKSNTGTHDQ